MLHIKETLFEESVLKFFSYYRTIFGLFAGVEVPPFHKVCKTMLCFASSFLVFIFSSEPEECLHTLPY